MTLRDGMKRRVLSTLLDSDAADNLTYTIAAVENELLEAAKPVDDALDGQRITHVPDIEDRQETLKTLLRAVATDSMREVWCEDVLADVVDAPEKATRHVGADPEEWERTKEGWADRYRDRGATGSTDALADHHIREVFGVDREEFRRRVVEWDAGQVAENLFAGNFRAVRDVLDAAAEEVSDGE